jgi:hypothetical protein
VLRKVGADSRGSSYVWINYARKEIGETSKHLYNMHYFLLQFQPSKSIQNKIRIRTTHVYLKIILPSRAMQFYAVLLPVATLLAATANAADCYSQSGSQTCLNSTDLLTLRNVS